MKTKVFKIEMMVIDFDGLGADGVKQAIEWTKYPNRCISPSVQNIQCREVDWSDEHPLNNTRTEGAAYAELFGDEGQVSKGQS